MDRKNLRVGSDVRFRKKDVQLFTVRTLCGEAIPRSMKIKIFALLLGGIIALQAFAADSLIAPEPIIKDDNIITKKEEQAERKRIALDLWVEELAVYECPSCGPNYRRVDINGLYSYGCLQFQEATFRSYALRYHLLTKEQLEDLNYYYRCDIQKQIVKRMFAEMGNTYEFGRNWYTSIYVKGLGLPNL